MNKAEIFVVDDDQIHNLLLQKTFEKVDLSSKLKFFNRSEDALSALMDLEDEGESLPKMILVEPFMNQRKGFLFLEIYQNRFFRNHQTIEVIALTKSIWEKHKRQVLQWSCVSSYLIKPFSHEIINKLYPEYVS
jgi:response regulator of citrate/malate metabolism